MSRRREAMKDVVDCDKPGAGVKQPLIPGFPNGETRLWETIVISGWMHRPFEANAGNWHISVPAGKEINRDSVSSGERTRISPNPLSCFRKKAQGGLRASVRSYKGIASRIGWKAGPQKVIVPYAKAKALRYCRCSRVARSSWNSVRSWGAHSPRLSTTRRPIVKK